MIAIVDYGVGNIFSLYSSFGFIGEDVVLSSDPEVIKKSKKIILPGVGAFADAAEKLNKSGLAEVVKAEAHMGKPLLGICLGMQLLFEKSFEYGEHDGLGLIKGNIRSISSVVSREYKIPHIGWNALHFPEGKPKSRLFKNTDQGECVYFVHSYYAADCAETVSATAEYGAELTAACEFENVYGTQFHPEKSGKVGLGILKAFCEL